MRRPLDTASSCSASRRTLAHHRDALVRMRLEPPRTLRDESGLHWSEITQGAYDFGRTEAACPSMAAITQKDLPVGQRHSPWNAPAEPAASIRYHKAAASSMVAVCCLTRGSCPSRPGSWRAPSLFDAPYDRHHSIRITSEAPQMPSVTHESIRTARSEFWRCFAACGISRPEIE